ncbi:MAG: choice-of-anchor Q domain-containing protein, partial [Saprospiraceae bacterium]
MGWNNPVLLTHCYFDSLNCSALPPSVTCGPGMIIGGDPMFVNPDSGDYRLRPCSPLVNAGSNAYVSTPIDLPGNPRIRGGTVDIGAYEHQGPTLAAAPSAQPSCPGGASGAIGIEVQEACP